MQFEVLFLLLFGFCHSAPHEGLPLLNPGGIGGVFQGKNSETIIIGPDGSEITSEEKSGVIVRDDALVEPIVVAEPEIAAQAPILTEERVVSASPIIASTGAPIIASAAPEISLSSPSTQLLTGETLGASIAPISASVAPIAALPEVSVAAAVAPIDLKLIEIVQQDPHIIETEIIDAPDVEPEQSSDLEGPSGRIITKGSVSVVSGPASTTITEPRRIIIAPPKIVLETPVISSATVALQEVPLAAPLPPITASTVAPLSAVALESASTIAPSVVGLSSASAPLEWRYSTTATPLQGVSSTDALDSSRINIGVGDLRESIPVVEYSSSNGVINAQNLAGVGALSSTEASILSSSISTITTGGAAVPADYLVAPPAPTNIAPAALGLVSSASTPNIQRIARVEDDLAVDGRVEMGYQLYRKHTPETFRLPHVLGEALSRFYQKTAIQDKESVVIDDKMGELTQNEIASYDSRPDLLSPPDLAQAKYIGPALARNGFDASQVNLAPVPLSQVTGWPDDAYQTGANRGYLSNRYDRRAKRRPY